jgi:hypothetical protein
LDVGVFYGKFGRSEGRTADPSATLGMTKGRLVFTSALFNGIEGTAGRHSATLRPGSPLRYASVGMTIHFHDQDQVGMTIHFDDQDQVGMTILFHDLDQVGMTIQFEEQRELISRP